MGMIQRDYVLRMIEQMVEVLARAAGKRRSGQLDDALNLLRQAMALIPDSMRALFERLQPSSVLQLVGDPAVVCVYAALVAEEAFILEQRGSLPDALPGYRHALELYGALSMAGVQLDQGDRARVATLLTKASSATIVQPYRSELERLRQAGQLDLADF